MPQRQRLATQGAAVAQVGQVALIGCGTQTVCPEDPLVGRHDLLEDVLGCQQISFRGADRTLDTTGLVHEAYLRLVDSNKATVRDREHFFALSSTVMRHVLVDSARERLAIKRGGDRQRVDFDSVQLDRDDHAYAVLEIDQVLDKLNQVNGRLVQVVECRFFAGLNEGETARALGVSRRSVQRDWVKASAWLRSELSEDRPASPQGPSSRDG